MIIGNYHLLDEPTFVGRSNFSRWNKTICWAKLVNVLVFSEPFDRRIMSDGQSDLHWATFSHQEKNWRFVCHLLRDKPFKFHQAKVYLII